MLYAKRNSDDGDAKDNAKTKVGKADPDSAKQQPEDVHKSG